MSENIIKISDMEKGEEPEQELSMDSPEFRRLISKKSTKKV